MILALLLAAQSVELCADRPSKSTAPCTVPSGHWQIESALADRTLDRSDDERTRTWTFGATVVKRGIGPSTDLEIGVPGYGIASTRSASERSTERGFGDTQVAIKQRLTGEEAKFGAALLGRVTLPTGARNFSAGAVEASVLVPLSVEMGHGLTLSSTPEADWRADDDGHGHHGAFSSTLALGVPIGEQMNLTLEGWAERERQAGVTAHRASADVTLAYSPTKRLQFDTGAYFGLTRDTPDLDVSVGVSVLF
jgi:Putative MetA-pathway of phenol degradation